MTTARTRAANPHGGLARCALLCAAAGLVILSYVIGTKDSVLDSDLWWLLASGQQIVDAGIPYLNPWSIHDGQGIIVQQWLSALILYGCYQAGGMLCLQLLVAAQALLLVWLLLKLCRVASGNAIAPDTALLICLLIMPAISAYWSTRPHLWTMIAYCLLLIQLEQFRATGRGKHLIPVPGIVLVHVNLHASMAVLDIVICLVYLLPSLAQAWSWFLIRETRQDEVSFLSYLRSQVPLLLASLFACSALLINPYGLSGALYTVLSYGAASYGDYISEMGSVAIWTDYGMSFFLTALLFAFLVGRGHPTTQRLSYFALPALFVIMSLSHTRNIWLFPLFSVPWLACALQAYSISDLLPKLFVGRLAHLTALVATGIGVVALCWGTFVPWNLEEAAADSISSPKIAIQYLENHGLLGSKMMADFDSGGYLEWHGMKVDMDARPELWEPAITGLSEHYYLDYVDRMQSATTDWASYVESNGFQIVLIATGCSADDYFAASPDWQMATFGNGYRLWIKSNLVA